MRTANRLTGPILFIVGDEDELCDPKATKEFSERCVRAQIEWRTYPGMRHELLNDIGREAVVADLCAWLDRQATS